MSFILKILLFIFFLVAGIFSIRQHSYNDNNYYLFSSILSFIGLFVFSIAIFVHPVNKTNEKTNKETKEITYKKHNERKTDTLKIIINIKDF